MSTDVVLTDEGEKAMDRWVVNSLIDWAAGRKAKDSAKESLRREMDEFAVELAGPNPTPIEKVLAQTAAINWFALRLHEAAYAGTSNSGNAMSIVQADYYQRRIDRAHKRFLSSVRTLAQVRKLALPALQVNIGAKQVNVANSP